MVTRKVRSSSRALAGALALWLALATFAFSRAAHAEDALRISVDWSKLDEVLRDGPAVIFPRQAETWRPSGSLDPHGSSSAGEEIPWIGKRPHLSLVARDWGGSQLLVGRLSLTDQLRLSRSVRMVVTRLRLANGRLAPFTQLGLGQWQVDTNLLPGVPHDVELAGQLGGGFELALTSRATLALEGDWTILYREQRAPEMISGPYLLSSFLAARVVF